MARLPLLVAIALCAAACKHDLDRLRRGSNDGVRDGGRGGSTSRSGSGGGGGSDAPPRDAGGDRDAEQGRGPCEPCPELGEQAMELGLRSCCRGLASTECGLTFGEGTVCLPRDVPGQEDSACTAFTAGGMRLSGCCRPDGRCGLMAEPTGLGCVAREQVLSGVGAEAAAPMACRYECEQDEECNVLPGGFVCAEHPTDGERFCADQCVRDQDCRQAPGAVCAFANDFGMNRVLAICRTPVGDLQPGAPCTRAEDCAHGVCVRVASGAHYCSELCVNGLDCPAGQRMCISSNISRPDGTGDPIGFNICRK